MSQPWIGRRLNGNFTASGGSHVRCPRTESVVDRSLPGRLLKLAVTRKLGRLPDSLEVMWHHPAVFKDLMRMGLKTEKWDRLDHNLASYAVMAAAAEIGCSFCLDFNYFMAHDRGLDRPKRAKCRGGGNRASSRRWSAG